MAWRGGDRRLPGGLSIAVLVASLASTVVPPPATAADPGGNGLIVFSSGDGASATQIWVMAPDGQDRVQLTDLDGAADLSPHWSADGTRIAFNRRSVGDTEIWTMDADGSNEVMVGLGMGPTWSPGGTQLALVDIVDAVFDRDIARMEADGSDRIVLTDRDQAIDVDWSPDGEWLVYGEDALGGLNGSIRLVRPNGSDDHEVLLTTAAPRPAWSPDGRRIAFVDTVDTDLEVITIAADGGSPVDLTSRHTTLPTRLGDPAYSPDGRWIIFTGYPQPGIGDLYRIAADGSGTPVNLTQTATVSELSPDWQPDPPYPFGDIGGSTFVKDIVWLRAEGLTNGCTDFWYCPDRLVTRAEVATFLDRALDYPPTTIDHFTDDDESTHEAAIDRLAAAGITRGCAPSRFCPDAPITRAEMATLMTRAFALPPTTIDAFSDDDDSIHESAINRLAAAGITTGCAADRYCPTATVTRGQMAAFLHRALD